jgi:hypothetical protein
MLRRSGNRHGRRHQLAELPETTPLLVVQAFAGEAPPLPPEWEYLEYGFWDQRPALTLIYQSALGRLTSPWAVFAATVARVLATVPPGVVLPPIVGGKGSLNWFAALAADSGGGKGAAGEVARELVPNVYTSNIGSAEGMTKLYQPDADGSRREAIMFDIDEIDSLAAHAGRGGSLLLSMLKSAWTAKKLTQAYKGTAPKDVVGDHEYLLSQKIDGTSARSSEWTGAGTGCSCLKIVSPRSIS